MKILFAVQVCRTFAHTGCCRYGKRCRFIHPATSTDGFFLQNMSPQTDITFAGYQPDPQAQSHHHLTVNIPKLRTPPQTQTTARDRLLLNMVAQVCTWTKACTLQMPINPLTHLQEAA